MRESIFSIDGVELRVNIIKLERGFSVTDTKNSGRLLDYSMHREVAGTFYNYTMEVEPYPEYREDYDTFYEIISAPTPSHQMIFPYAQRTMSFQAYITQGKDTMKRVNNKNLWNGLSVYFVAMEPQRRP